MKSDECVDCCIVGAGVAGLIAAQTLARAGRSVVVVEARGRTGGRVCPMLIGANLLHESEASLYSPVEVQAGANWVHDLRVVNPIYRLLSSEKLAMHKTSCGAAFDNCTQIADRNHYDTTREPRLFTDIEKNDANDIINFVDADETVLRKRLRKNRAKQQHEFTLSNAFNRSLARYCLKHETTISESSLQLLALNKEYRGFSEGFELDQISFTRSYDETTDDHTYGEAIICAGTSHILKTLSKDLDIRLNSAVSEVLWADCCGEGSMAVVTKSGGVIRTDAVIVTTSIGVLKRGLIEFKPKLPNDIICATNVCEMGLLDIVLVRFRNVFWDSETTLFAVCPPISPTSTLESPRSDLFSHFYNLKRLRATIDLDFPPVLMCEVSGDKARIVESMTTAEIASSVVRTLEILFGVGNVEFPIGCVIHKWGEDEFCFGSYFNYTVGVSPEHIQALNRPLCGHIRNSCADSSCLQFAGEACNASKIATLQGAYESGLKAALHIINRHSACRMPH